VPAVGPAPTPAVGVVAILEFGDPLLVVGILLSSRNANVRKWAPKTCQAAASSREGEIKLFAETIFLCQRQKKVDPFSGLRCPENGTGTA
jgi:hypothetical protein